MVLIISAEDSLARFGYQTGVCQHPTPFHQGSTGYRLSASQFVRHLLLGEHVYSVRPFSSPQYPFLDSFY